MIGLRQDSGWLQARTRGTAMASRMLGSVREFYRRRGSRLTLVIAAPVLCYGGGAVMFWFHAYYRGEAGPAINPWLHWLVDSTIGFVGLTPALFFLLPAAAQVLAARGRRSALALGALVGAGFALVTGPGPVVHDLLVGQHGPVGLWAVQFFGSDPVVEARNLLASEHNAAIEGLLQLAVGLVVYVGLTWLSLAVVARMLALRVGTATPRRGTLVRAASPG